MVILSITKPDCEILFARCDLGDVLLGILTETKEPRSVSPGPSLTGRSNLYNHHQQKQQSSPASCEDQYGMQGFGKIRKGRCQKEVEGSRRVEKLTNLQPINRSFNQANSVELNKERRSWLIIGSGAVSGWTSTRQLVFKVKNKDGKRFRVQFYVPKFHIPPLYFMFMLQTIYILF